MPARESALVKRVKAYLRSRGAYVVKTCPPMEKGTPDLLVCYRGVFLGIELKAEGEGPTELQKLRLAAIRKAGGVGFWTDDLGAVRLTIDTIDDILSYENSQLGMLPEAGPC